MLTEEGKRKLYSHARDDAERQRLLAAFRTDSETVLVHGLFETGASLLIIGAVSFGAAAAISWTASFSPDFPLKSQALLVLFIVTFIGTCVAINWSFDGERGKTRKSRFDLAVTRYGYPIILAAGIGAGWLAQTYLETRSERGYAASAAIRACLKTPACIQLARAINHDSDVRWVLSN